MGSCTVRLINRRLRHLGIVNLLRARIIGNFSNILGDYRNFISVLCSSYVVGFCSREKLECYIVQRKKSVWMSGDKSNGAGIVNNLE